MKENTKILFVCMGNICRSPAAEGIFKEKVKKAGLSHCIEVDSAGTYGGHVGELPDSRMRKAAHKRGYSLESRSRKFQRNDFDRFDYIVVMDDLNYEEVIEYAMSTEAEKKIIRMADFCSDAKIDHIPDPYYEGVDGFEYVLDLLEKATDDFLKLIVRKIS